MSEETIFAAALELPSADRAAYLAKACGTDAALRQRLEGLLHASDRAGGFMARPAVESADPAGDGTELLNANSTPYDVTVSRAWAGRPAADDEVPLGFLAPATRPDSLGRIGHYEVLQVLGHGGFGIVFRAFDDVLHRVVAVKVLAPQLAATSPARKRFLREARSSAQVRHENVVQVYEVGESPLPYIAMEFIPGETLQQRLNRVGPVDAAEVVRVGRQVAEGLAAAHATDLIHRDIKPGNILLEGGARRVKITDFGLARAADDASISQSGLIAGTPMYMAPEQAKGEKLDQRADLFSLGSVLYQMAAGRPPFRANGTVAVLKRVAEDTPRDIREITPETPQWLCDIIAKLHAKNPDDRFQSAREVADVLADCEAQLKANSKLKDFSRIPRGKPRPLGRRKWVAAAAALLLPVIALAVTEFAGVTHLFRTGRDPIQPGQEPGSSELPRTAADGLPFLVGNWKSTSPPPEAKRPHDLGRDASYTTFDFVADGKFLRQRGMRHAIFAYDAEKGVLRQWAAAAVAPGGLTWGPATGLYNPTNRTVTWTAPADGGKEVIHQSEVIDANTIDVRAFMRDAQSNVVQDLPVRLTRVNGPVPLPDWPVDPNRPPEMKVLDRLVGEWRDEMTVTDVATPDKPKAETARVKAESILGGRFVESIITAEPDKHSDYTLAWYDSAAKKYRQWFFNGAGYVVELTGTWDEAAKTLTWTSVDGRLEGHWVFMGDDQREFRHVIKTADGKLLAAGVSRRFAVAPFTDADVKRIAALPAEQQVEEVRKELVRRNPGFAGQMEPTIVGGAVTGVRFDRDRDMTDISPLSSLRQLQVLVSWGGRFKDLSPLRGLPLRSLSCYGNDQLRDLAPLKGLPLENLMVWSWAGDDLSPLKGMQLKSLVCGGGGFRLDLSPLKGMPLVDLSVNTSLVDDLTPLSGMPLRRLHVANTRVADLSPLKGMPLEELACRGSPITDWRPIKDAPLKRLEGDFVAERDAEVLRAIKTLESINGQPVAEFWKDVDQKQAADREWLKRVSALPASEQVEEVRKELVRRNPGFDGKVGTKIEGGVVTEFGINTDTVTDIAPIRVFNALRVLNCAGTYTDKPNGLLADLTPLEGMNLGGLTHLDLHCTKVTDAGMAHFKDCKDLTFLYLSCTTLTDSGLAHFSDCKNLTFLSLGGTGVSDAGLLRLRDCEGLAYLNLSWTKVTDAGLARFQNCKGLKELDLAGTNVGNTGLAGFRGMPLVSLWIYKTDITDLTPIQSMPLEEVRLTPRNITRGLELLRGMKGLKTIGTESNQSWPAAEFWERYDKGEFTK